MPRGFRFRWFHGAMALLWLALVAVYWADLVAGPGHERMRVAVLLVFLGWGFVASQLLPDGTDADEIRRTTRLQGVVNGLLLGLVVVWVWWDARAEGRDLMTLVFPVLPALMLALVVVQYLRADRSAARAQQRLLELAGDEEHAARVRASR